jgi:hypothetical protein
MVGLTTADANKNVLEPSFSSALKESLPSSRPLIFELENVKVGAAVDSISTTREMMRRCRASSRLLQAELPFYIADLRVAMSSAEL